MTEIHDPDFSVNMNRLAKYQTSGEYHRRLEQQIEALEEQRLRRYSDLIHALERREAS